jgi:outer membrane protein, multidrug efflux system
MGRWLAPLLLLGLAAGCSMAPRYERPAAPVAADFPAGGPAPVAAPAAADLGWRDVFGDPRLQALVALALEQNRDLRVAALHVELVQAQYRIQRAQRLPQVGASGVATFLRTPGDLTTTGTATTSEAWAVGVGMTGFELDFFGRVKSLSDAALEQFLATEEARRSAQLSLVASVATQYLAGRALEEQVSLTRETLDSVVEALRLMRRAFEAGRVSELDLRSAEAQVEAARFALAAAELQRVRSENALALLVGGPLPSGLPPPLPLDGSQVVAGLQAGIPSEVLVRRPDVLAAEHALKSANATIGAARAAFFPSISLTAFDGTASVSLSGLFQAGSLNWSFVPRINIPIFAGGALRASLDAAEVRTSMEVARYERAVQGAFREVSDALSAQGWIEEQLQAQAARVEAESRRYDLSVRRYRGGVDGYLNVLTAQRDLFAARQVLIQTRLARLTNLVDLYKALGGGWRERRAEEPGGAGPPTPAGAAAGPERGPAGS